LPADIEPFRAIVPGAIVPGAIVSHVSCTNLGIWFQAKDVYLGHA
jgi:hypothetical protein